MTVRILGIGNPILSDDAVGIAVARHLKSKNLSKNIEVREVESGGMDLLEEFRGCDAAIIIDAIITGTSEPGSIMEYSLEELPMTRRLRGAHDADIGSALELGRKLGMELPKVVRVLAVEVLDNSTFGLEMTPSVAEVVVPAAEQALAMARNALEEVA